jgi:hypothetical protein
VISIEKELQPFQVPNYVIEVPKVSKRQDGFQETPKHHLSELDGNVLDQLCERFREDVFKKAGKNDPRNEKES